MATFREICGDDYPDLLNYEPYISVGARGFVNHVAREPDRELSAAQHDWAVEIIKRAVIHRRIEQGQCALPRSLDDDSFEQFLAS